MYAQRHASQYLQIHKQYSLEKLLFSIGAMDEFFNQPIDGIVSVQKGNKATPVNVEGIRDDVITECQSSTTTLGWKNYK